MSADAFLDTNVFVYSIGESDPDKAAIARGLIDDCLRSRRGKISYQVVQEFCNAVLRKAVHPLRTEDLDEYLQIVLRPMLAVESSLDLFRRGLELQQRYRLAWYDSLIVAAAQAAGCGVLYSEDLQHGQRFGSVTVQNPFQR